MKNKKGIKQTKLKSPADNSLSGSSRPSNKRQRDSTSTVNVGRVASLQFTGVSWLKANEKWVADIQIDEKKTYLGCFHDEVAAAHRYDEAAVTLGMPLNFNVSTSGNPGANQTKRQRPAPDVAPSVAHETNELQVVCSPGPVRMTASL